MSNELLSVLVLLPTAAVVIAIFAILRRAASNAKQSRTAEVSGIVLAVWAMLAMVLAYRGFFRPPSTHSFPPIGTNLIVVFLALALCLALSSSLRSLVANQRRLTWLHVWRLEGVVFLILMAAGQMPALWALPAGIGDIIVGVTAPFVATRLATPGGRKLAVVFNLFGMADLVVAVALGVMTSPGPTQVLHTHPTSELVTQFPLALVPTFLVPLAFTIHVISLWQLLQGTWAKGSASPASA